MRKALIIAEREFKSLLTSPIGFVVMTFFLFVSGVFFIAPLQANIANMRYVVGNTTIWLVFLLPALTMRLLAEEKKTGTIELLMTSPVTEAQVVLGKFLGVLGYYVVILFSTLQYVFVLGMVRKSDANPIFPTYVGLLLSAATLIMLTATALHDSRRINNLALQALSRKLRLPEFETGAIYSLITSLLGIGTIVTACFSAQQMGEWGPALTGYLGLFMIGAVFLAIGVLMSALTRNQIIAWVSTAAVLLLLVVLISWLTQNMPKTAPELEASPNFGSYLAFGFGWIFYALAQVLDALNLQVYLQNFAQGVLDIRDFVLYLSLIVLSLFFAVRGLATSRWA